MPKRHKNYKDAIYYVPSKSKKNSKRRVAGSTTATSKFLGLIHEENPALTISQLRALLLDRSKYILSPEAITVLDAHIKAGYGDTVPNWRY